MTPPARAAAAVEILDRILAGEPAEAALTRWARASRFAGSGDRAAVRDLVYDSLRRRSSRAALGGGLSGRGLILGMCREQGIDPDTIFGAGRYAPTALSGPERDAGQAPDSEAATDLPGWLLPSLRSSLDAAFDGVASTLRDRAPVWLRVNRLRGTVDDAVAALSEDGIEVVPHATLSSALQVTEGARHVASSRAFREGLFELQDVSPQRAVAALGDLTGLEVLDYCAGGGGKALALAAAGAARIVAHDVSGARMADLPRRASRAEAQIEVANPGAVDGHFDLVVADVPCSGSGSWRRDPEARWRLTPERIGQLGQLQTTILDEAASHLRPGGRLAYMTCSLLEDENAGRIAAFLKNNPSLRLEDEHHFLPPEGDGFYLAVLQHIGMD